MKLSRFVWTVLLIPLAAATVAEDVKVSIERIVANDRIFGRVQGQLDYSKHKVIVYVKTDRWYVHPYAVGGEGRSWARIKSDGTWELPTVRREFEADAIAAVVTDIRYEGPTTTENVAAVPHRAIFMSTVRGTPDEGKL